MIDKWLTRKEILALLGLKSKSSFSERAKKRRLVI
jgi:hypothetical protein